MKFLLFFFFGLLAYCHYHPQIGNERQTPLPEPSDKRQVLYILVNDVSQSDAWLALSSADIFDLLLSDTNNVASVQLAGLLINEQGHTQQPYLSDPLPILLQSEKGTVYERAAIKLKNRQIMAQYKQGCKNTVDSFAQKILLPRQAPWSDVNGALVLAERLSKLPCYRNHDIILVLLSDLNHDLPDGSRLKLSTFPPNVTIYVVGQDHTIVSKFFPNNQVIVLPHFNASFLSTS